MKHLNLPLIAGTLLTTLVLILTLAGPSLAPHDPLERTTSLNYGGVAYGLPPDSKNLPPFIHPEYPLGWDFGRRDLLSRLLYALQPTLAICVMIALLRVLIGVVFGLVSGWQSGWLTRSLNALAHVLQSLPVLMVVIGILFVVGRTAMLPYVLGLAVVGWIDSMALVQMHTRTARNMAYVESARAIGLGPVAILVRHIFPHIFPLLPLLLAYELSATLLLMAELGYLGFFFGGAGTMTSGVGMGTVTYFIDERPELAQMLSGFFLQLYDTPWQNLIAGAVIACLLCAFALLAEGLRRRLDITRPRRRWWKLLKNV